MSGNSIKNYFTAKAIKRANLSSSEATESASDNSANNASATSLNDSILPEKRLRIEQVNDIAKFCRRQLNVEEKYLILTADWKPDASFKYPASGNRNLKFQISWFNNFNWLLYSSSEDGTYCKYCVVFASKEVGKGSHQNPSAFVQTPFSTWQKALEKFKEHQLKGYHKDALEDAANFKLIYENKKNDILCEIDSARKKKQMENRKKLSSIIRTVLLCGRQGLALRGHHDYGTFSLKMPTENDGNFRSLLRFAIESGDNILKSHIESAGENATYISWRIQNEIIESAGQIIQRKIVNRINSSKYFSIIADETTDVSGIEQFSLCARYVDAFEHEKKLREDFLCFLPVEDLTGAGLSKTLLNKLRDLNINVKYLRGQGYDGARAMSGEFKGCGALVQKEHPEAIYVHCANHSLNLAVANSCKIAPIRNCIGVIKDTINLFRNSTKAGTILKNVIVESCPTAKQTRLLKFCETRWVEHLDSLSLFFDVFHHICTALEEIDGSNIRSDGTKPHALLAAMRTPQFIISLTILKPIFALSRNVSKVLQQEDLDLSNCLEYVSGLHDEIGQMRENADQYFNKIFNSAKVIGEETGICITIPRLVSRQTNRDNYDGCPEQYFRRSIFIPFLDHFLEELKERFLKHREVLSKIENILPQKCVNQNDLEMKETVRVLYSQWPNDFKDSEEEFIAELKLWRRHNLKLTDLRTTFIDTVNVCDAQIFPNIYEFLKIGATLPVSVASSERTFSSLRRLKTYLRSKTKEQRLNGLALLNIHRDIGVTHEEILNDMANKSRRLNIML